jgi:aminoglycoside phosphotransferase (APT) family kinase protein
MDEKSLIENKIKQHFPNETIKLLVEGGMSFAFEVGKNIVRIPRTDLSKIEYEREEKILNYLANKIENIEIPDIKTVRFPFFYSIHKKINGSHWNGSEYLKKSALEKDLLAYDCALFFAGLHSADISKIDTEIPEIRQLQQDIEYYLSIDFSDKEIYKIVSYTEVLYSLNDKCLIHNDFYPPNFFIDDNFRLKAVIDFARAQFNNFNFDFRKIISYQEGEKDFWDRIVKTYENITQKRIDIEIIKVIDIYNYMDFMSYFAKHFKIEKGNIPILNRWSEHINYVKSKIKEI